MERLTDDRFLKDGFYQPKSKEEEKEIRSMGNDLTFEKLYKHCAEVEKENAKQKAEIEAWKAKSRELEQSWEIASSNEEKLRKQVNELTSQNEWLKNENDYLKKCADAFLGDYKNSVKDTAKEILQIFIECVDEIAKEIIGDKENDKTKTTSD